MWDQPGVPHRAWRCVDVEDLGAADPRYTPGTCEMCGKHPLRFIHTMEHDNYGPLDVGSVCAVKMATDYDAKAAEKKLKSKAGMKSRWLSRQWRTSWNGNPMLRRGGLTIGVFPRSGRGWSFWIAEQEQKPKYSGRSYETEDEAKLALFEAYWEAKQ